MKRTLGKIALTLAALSVTVAAAAQKVAFEASVPTVVAVGEVFRVEFSLDAEPTDFTAPPFEGMDVLAGPSKSTGKSISIVNGQMSETLRIAYTYVLQCNAPGTYTVPPAQVTVDGKTYRTRPVTLQAVVEDSPATQPTDESAAARSTKKPTLAPDDILLRMEADRRQVFKGQPVKLTLKLYKRVPVSGIEDVKYPSFNGFWSQQLSGNDYKWMRETLGNKIYDSRIIVEYILLPQVAGQLTVDPFELTASVQIISPMRSQSLFDDFFGGPPVEEISRRLKAEPVKITVKELPSGAPESFAGAVGDFRMEATPPPNRVKANSASTYTVRISGSGNLPLVQAPRLELPASFEQYNTKTTESIQSNAQGISGYRQFEYPFIARAEGTFEIAPAEFTYFNPRTARYETLASQALELEVSPDSTGSAPARGIVSGISKEDLRILGQDIRFIKLGQARLHPRGETFMWSPMWFVIAGMLGAAFAAAYVLLRRHLRQLRNAALLKGKRANKTALLRFRAAADYMKEGNQRGFYEEMLRALWGYLSDKLNMPVANLTKENVRERLVHKGIPADEAERYITVIGECEYAQYAPARLGRMEESYAAGIEIVSKLESHLGKRL